MTPTPTTFESALERLEAILSKMNSGSASLEESLQLYQEADLLIQQCNQRLLSAEKKIEMLIKNREGELVMGSDQLPQTTPFQETRDQILSRPH